jgi:hypothetical protein
MKLQEALDRIARGQEFVHTTLGYGLRRKINSGPLKDTFHVDDMTKRTADALKKRGHEARLMY